MNRLPGADELTSAEIMSLVLVSRGFMSKGTIPAIHQARLVQLGLIHLALGGLMATPAGRMVARIQVGS
jgi:hypothetical protein